MEKNGSNLITAEDIAGQIGMSRVSVKRYLDYLVSTGKVIMEIEYGSVERPSYKYMWDKHKSE